MRTIDLNCDMGELKPGQGDNFDAAIMPFISSCNIACGFHSGSPQIIENTIRSAIAHEVTIGAHPSYNDRKNFGRVSIKTEPAILMAELRYQICAVKGMVESFGQRLNHVKPHGALYNDMAGNEYLADQFIKLVKSIDPDLKIFALAHSILADCCKRHQMRCVHEGFADRRYEKQNLLRSRRFDDAVLHKPVQVLAQIEGFLQGRVILFNKEVCAIQVESVCLHSDTQGAVDLSLRIHQFLTEKNVRISGVI